MVKAIRFHEFGGPEVLKLEDVDIPDPGPGQLRIRHTVAGFNFLDVLTRMGKYPVLPELPSMIGTEGAGVVDAIGEGVSGFARGDRVAYAAMAHGSYSEARLLDAASAVKLPSDIADDAAAASMLKGMTVEYLVRRCYPVQKGETVLVHAAAGGVGLFLCQWLKHIGAEVIGTVGSDEKKKTILEHGATHAVNYRTESFRDVVREVTGGKGVRVVYDSVGPDVYRDSLDSLGVRGFYVNFGNASGPLPPIDAVELNVKGSLYFTKASMRFYQLTRQELEDSAAALFEVMRSGAVTPVIGQRYALDQAAQAQIDVWERKTTGSTVIDI